MIFPGFFFQYFAIKMAVSGVDASSRKLAKQMMGIEILRHFVEENISLFSSKNTKKRFRFQLSWYNSENSTIKAIVSLNVII